MIKNGKCLHYGDLMNKILQCMLNGMNCKTAVWTVVILSAAATYLTVIETAKMHGLEVRDYLVHVFREIMNGNKYCSTYVS